MTTIAFDGTYLAVDRAGWKQNYTFYETDKLSAVLKNFSPDFSQYPCYYAAAGSGGDAVAIREWLAGITKTKPDIHEKGEAKGLIVTSSGLLYAVTGVLTFARILTVPWADGGGSDMALGAMAAGKTAPQAIEIVAKHSTWAAIGLDYVNVRTGQVVRTMFSR